MPLHCRSAHAWLLSLPLLCLRPFPAIRGAGARQVFRILGTLLIRPCRHPRCSTGVSPPSRRRKIRLLPRYQHSRKDRACMTRAGRRVASTASSSEGDPSFCTRSEKDRWGQKRVFKFTCTLVSSCYTCSRGSLKSCIVVGASRASHCLPLTPDGHRPPGARSRTAHPILLYDVRLILLKCLVPLNIYIGIENHTVHPPVSFTMCVSMAV